jgi:hypothetical protein
VRRGSYASSLQPALGRLREATSALVSRRFTGSAVYFSGSDNPVTPDLEQVIPTVVLGWERRLTRRTNGILQLYASPSVVQGSALDELTADKYLLSLGFQTRRGGWFYRYALTENLQNFSNTPDVGVTFSVARVMFGR